VHRGDPLGAIASRLGRATSAVSREVAANGGIDLAGKGSAVGGVDERSQREERPGDAIGADEVHGEVPIRQKALATCAPRVSGAEEL
jgi:hypothetical protein